MVQAGIQRAREVPRNVALEKVNKNDKSEENGRQHRLIVQYDRRSSPALGTILRNNYEAACNRDSRFKTIFPNVPKPVFKRGKNLKQLLCRAKLPKPKPVNTRASDRQNKNGVSRCNKGKGRKQCGACVYLTKHPNQVKKTIKINSSGESVKIEDPINCKTKSCIYVLESDKSPKQYAGQSGGPIGRRALQHANDIENDRIEKAVPDQFKKTGFVMADVSVAEHVQNKLTRQ